MQHILNDIPPHESLLQVTFSQMSNINNYEFFFSSLFYNPLQVIPQIIS